MCDPFLIFEVLPRGATLADFGAGGGGYSVALNATGMIQAFAFDGPQMNLRLLMTV